MGKRNERFSCPFSDRKHTGITPAGYEHYARIAEQAGHVEQVEQIRTSRRYETRNNDALRNDGFLP
jgi:hypothetical protein